MKTWTITILLLCLGCPPPQPPTRPFNGEATCESLCANLAELQCEAARDADGLTCVELCEDMVDAGAPIPLRCVTEAGSCPAADACK